ncbi:CBS domain-containing protein [Sedimentimonas flavescens]|uniref:CBS domain-containing protein n=1 Tax=Sedimentimonas flavescens TaxID=2851012 RepID=UPI0021A3DFB9|nr:CBS domain-containing protein [Sedimentimonas flavescens]MCT2538962.1 CBS domain-containing protein [Sedimentimonas flavescens]WBL32215.1 CBS domain-containing protein [Sinirhodobacter sp. HNIBRBA609]
MSLHETLHMLVVWDMPVLQPDMPIRRAVAILVQENAAAAAVIDDSGALKGLLSQKDCFRPTLNASYYQEWTGTVADFMTTNLMTLPVSTDITDAAEAFLTHSFHLFPVLDGEQFVGMLKRSDLLKRLVEMG